MSGRFGQRNAETKERRIRRQELADTTINASQALRNVLHAGNPAGTVSNWKAVLGHTYDALNAASPLLPRGLLHLHRSIQAACGEALGKVSRFDSIGIRDETGPIDFDALWAEHARDYVDLVTARLRQWRESKERAARTITAPTYDDWLRATGRYAPA